ncbi:hypothetical protein PG985_007904 [Apiospora marii]|uniref:Uncharacterized protein n=1 Tax=Apiospora marii TaxID=335849 RepID=A0ABR1R8X4_9PEZI
MNISDNTRFMYIIKRLYLAVKVFERIQELIALDRAAHPDRIPGSGQQDQKRKSNAIRQFALLDTGGNQHLKWKDIRSAGEGISQLRYPNSSRYTARESSRSSLSSRSMGPGEAAT